MKKISIIYIFLNFNFLSNMATKIFIEETKQTPFIHFDTEKNMFEISGRSLPEDVNKFYNPIREWITEYVKSPNPDTELVFNLEYFNSSSARIIVKILVELEKIKNTNNNIKVIWKYKEDDELMYDRGIEIQSVVMLPFELQAY